MNGIGWDGLEEAIEGAATRLADLRNENAELKRRLSALERRLAAGEDEGGGHWRQEREELARRADLLVDRLEKLIETASAEPSA